MNIKKTIQKTILLIGTAMCVPIQAGTVTDSCFQYPAVAMTPYDESVSKYHATHSRVYHQPDETGSILLYGPVQFQPTDYDNNFDSYIFQATYSDPDASQAGSQVVAQLRFIDNNGGVYIIETLASNEQFSQRTGVTTMREVFSLNVRNDGYYIVRMYVQRADTSLQPVAIGYSLCRGFIVE